MEIANQNLEMAKSIHMPGLKISFAGNTSSINRIPELMDEIIVNGVNSFTSRKVFYRINYNAKQ